jgi:hypothetical protein
MHIPKGHILKSAYIPIEDIVFTCDVPMGVEGVRDKINQWLSHKEGQSYPLPVGEWKDGKLHLWDGRHRYIAALMLARKSMLIAWVEKGEENECLQDERGTVRRD